MFLKFVLHGRSLKMPINRANVALEAPIPGMSLTTEPGNRPWEQPPQYATVEEALDYYVPRIMEPKLRDGLLDVIELGIPLTTIANTLQTGGVMEGKHTVDVGILILPVLMETLAFVGDSAGIEYDMGIEDEEEELFTPARVALALKKMDKWKVNDSQKKEAVETEEEDEMHEAEEGAEEEAAEEMLSGLMARR